jgi:hypothetical protein
MSGACERMQRVFGWGAACLVALVLATALPARVEAQSCSVIYGNVTFNGLEIVPAAPKVGDTVELRFDVGLAVFSVDSVALQGAAPLLDGDLVHSSGTTFALAAVQAGSTQVQLRVTYGTEEACTDTEGNVFYQYGPSVSVTSPPYDLVVLDATSPTPSPTTTPSPTPTSLPGGGDDGCQLRPARGRERSAPIPALALGICTVLAMARRRRSRRAG